jgi:hypothetical protein
MDEQRERNGGFSTNFAMDKDPENWSAKEVARFFAKGQSRGAGPEDTQILKRLLEKRVKEAKTALRERSRKMN